ncbi:C40 family peptidase [Marinobacter sp. F4206]|uniref:C40 family peptidase n=1 Tax=Marinobacter sp. F4206 TaxID=2861777 RepID=UPI001C5E61E1|nr:NlpC/P60 family protein [Marinobacter sp. F4206]MBW4935885.1 C40 family peptidase [Marinobacter sp. F4206]
MAVTLRQSLILVILAFALGGCASNQNLRTGSGSGLAPIEPVHSSEKAQRLWQVYERYAGVPYEYGGTSAQGFDCSGFILTAYREGLGQQLPRTTSQMLRYGKAIAPGAIQPGDLVFFRIRGKEQHAGIYMGNDRFIHASTSVGVTQSKLDGYYWKDRFTEARRFD